MEKNVQETLSLLYSKKGFIKLLSTELISIFLPVHQITVSTVHRYWSVIINEVLRDFTTVAEGTAVRILFPHSLQLGGV